MAKDDRPIQVGGLYAIKSEDGSWGVVKVLALDDYAVHLRSYANRFPEQPKDVESAKLTLGGINDPAGFGIGFKDSWNRAMEDVRQRGGKPYGIPAGASDHRLGGLGFANWAYEVQRQEEQLGVFFDTIVVCTVTGSTHAGMIAGFAGQDRPRRVVGIDASAKLDETREQVERIARRTAELIGVPRDLRDDEITVLEGWAGELYGVPVDSTLDAIRLVGGLEGVILDTVYEGKSMAGLLDLVRTGEIGPESNVLYAHLGGQPALNAYSALFR